MTCTKQVRRLPAAVATGLVHSGDSVDRTAVLARPDVLDEGDPRFNDLDTMTPAEFGAVLAAA